MSEKLLGFCAVFFLVDLGCIVIGKSQGWLYSLGMHGLVTDFLLVVVLVGLHLFRKSG